MVFRFRAVSVTEIGLDMLDCTCFPWGDLKIRIGIARTIGSLHPRQLDISTSHMIIRGELGGVFPPIHWLLTPNKILIPCIREPKMKSVLLLKLVGIRGYVKKSVVL